MTALSCRKFAAHTLILKTYRNKIWIFDREKYKKKDSVATVKPIDIVPGSLSWNTTLAGTYTGGEFTYSNQKKKSEYQGDNRNGRPDVEAKPVCIK